jgi:hypothetical protein
MLSSDHLEQVERWLDVCQVLRSIDVPRAAFLSVSTQRTSALCHDTDVRDPSVDAPGPGADPSWRPTVTDSQRAGDGDRTRAFSLECTSFASHQVDGQFYRRKVLVVTLWGRRVAAPALDVDPCRAARPRSRRVGSSRRRGVDCGLRQPRSSSHLTGPRCQRRPTRTRPAGNHPAGASAFIPAILRRSASNATQSIARSEYTPPSAGLSRERVTGIEPVCSAWGNSNPARR